MNDNDPARVLGNVTSGIGYARGAKSSGLLAVAVNGIEIVMDAARDVTFAAGDPVAFVKAGARWVAVCRVGTAAVTENTDAAVPPAASAGTAGSRTFVPVETRSRQGSRWRTDTDDVYQGQYAGNGNHIGCAFYGAGPRSLAGVTVTSATVKVRRHAGGGTASAQATTLRLVTEKTRPSGAPTLTSTTAGPALRWGSATDFTVPTAWAQAIVDGTSGGLAIYEADGDPYVIMDGRGVYIASFALTVRWSRA